MAINHKLLTDADFEDSMQREARVRVFKDDYIVNSGGNIVRFDSSIIVIQSSVSEITYYERKDCEFFEIRKK